MNDSPNTPDGEARIGVDSWVAEAEERQARGRGLKGYLRIGWERTPDPVKLIVFLGFAASLPFWLSEGDLYSFALLTMLYLVLGLGLNVVVGFAGLLDLGYVAFYGIGAYAYAELSSDHYGLHWPAEVSIPLVMIGTAFAGLVLGFSSRRLLGDYLAIVTLFFGQAFLVFANTSDPVIAGVDVTGGSNGIANIDKLTFFGYHLNSSKQEFFFTLIVFVVLLTALHFVNQSRTGRAWRALREDPLAAAALTIPVNRLKLTAFALGASIAGLAGCMLAAIQGSVVATNFTTTVLIIIYAVVILGGLGSLAGTILGAIVINVSYYYLAPQNDHPDIKRWLFYGTVLLFAALIKPFWKGIAVLAGTIAFGLLAHAVVAEWAGRSWTSGHPISGGKWLADWVVIPRVSHGNFNNYLYIGLVLAIILCLSVRGWWRLALLPPILYLVAVVWENVLLLNSGITALLLFGAMLVALMTVRPQGLLGTSRVEIV
ncbi:MAG: branched-chain amino acid transport system permease protein [Gaiellaceae bacterium]|jgi:branched-chain amino acid transport system permease protein|nr:branched-chain amino acid transport system permease protein [Gaiellaceae bacterium]